MRSLLFALAAAPLFAGSNPACSSLSNGFSLTGQGGSGTYVAGSPTSTFRTDISAMPVDPRSTTWMSYIPTQGTARAVMSYDIDYTVKHVGYYWPGQNVHYIDGSKQRRVVIRDNPAPREAYGGDPGTFPFPQSARIQNWYGVTVTPGGSMYMSRPFGFLLGAFNGPSDQHIIAVDTDSCVEYEAYGCYDDGSNVSCAAYEAFYMPAGDRQVPYGTTGGFGVSGVPVMSYLLRAKEWASGAINHALGMSVQWGNNVAMTGAAVHAQCCGNWDRNKVPFGARVRLKASHDSSTWDPNNVCAPLVKTLKTYGSFIADGGANGQIFAENTFQWVPGMDSLSECEFRAFAAGFMFDQTNFEVVQTGPIYCYSSPTSCPDGGMPTGPTAAVTSFAAGALDSSGRSRLTWSVTGVVDADGKPVPMRNVSIGVNPFAPCTRDGSTGNKCKLGPGWLPTKPVLDGQEYVSLASQHGYVWHLSVRNQFGWGDADATVP